GAGLGFDIGRQALELLGAHDQRRQIEAEGELDFAGIVLPRISLAIRTVAPNDQARVDQHSKVTTKRRCRHTVRAPGELMVRREDYEMILTCERRLRMEGQQRV